MIYYRIEIGRKVFAFTRQKEIHQMSCFHVHFQRCSPLNTEEFRNISDRKEKQQCISRFKWNMCNLFITVEYDKLYLRHLKATIHNGSLHLMMELGMIRHVHACVCVEHVLKMLLMEIVCGWIEQHLWARNRFIGRWWLTGARCTTKNRRKSF